jgi:hypothetical protein
MENRTKMENNKLRLFAANESIYIYAAVLNGKGSPGDFP